MRHRRAGLFELEGVAWLFCSGRYMLLQQLLERDWIFSITFLTIDLVPVISKLKEKNFVLAGRATVTTRHPGTVVQTCPTYLPVQ